MDRALVESCYTPAALEALAHFPIEVEAVELVARSENVTFRVTDRSSGNDYVLRLHRPGYNSLEELNSERAWTSALNEAGISAPDSVLTRQGEHFVLVDVPGTSEQQYAGLTLWFEGMPLCDYLETESGTENRQYVFARIGELIAATHNQSVHWNAPPGFTRPRLDFDGLLGETPRWGRFWEHAALTGDEQALLLRTREKLRGMLNDYGAEPENFSLIHADLNADNIVYNEGDLALIDFDDSAFGWHMYDIAAALIDDTGAVDFDAIRAALLDGYRRYRPLMDRDVDMLPAFLLIRGMVTIGWYHQRPEHAGSNFVENIRHWVIDKSNVVLQGGSSVARR